VIVVVVVIVVYLFQHGKQNVQLQHNKHNIARQPLSKLSIPPLVIDYNQIELACRSKLFGVYINDLSWNMHVD